MVCRNTARGKSCLLYPSGALRPAIGTGGDRWAELGTRPIVWVLFILQGEAASRGMGMPLGVGLCFRKPVVDPFVMVPVEAPCVGQVSEGPSQAWCIPPCVLLPEAAEKGH